MGEQLHTLMDELANDPGKTKSWADLQNELFFIIARKANVEKQISWADLPNVLLSEIYSRINAVDWILFRSVCRSWKQVHALTTPLQFPLKISDLHSPYLLLQNNKLYNPIYGTHYHVDSLFDMPGAIINFAKDGWLLVTYNLKDIFFYNPCSKTIVQLPDLPRRGTRSMCFSAPPTSKGWLVIVAKTNRFNEIVLNTIKDGEERWSTFDFVRRAAPASKFKLSNCCAVIHEGLFYFLGQKAQLLVYNPENNNFSLQNSCRNICEELKAYGGQQYMVESDGKLLVVFVNRDGSLIRVCQWDISNKKWETLESLGNKMMYVSAISSICESAHVKRTGNKIYFPRCVGDNCLFYCLSTKKYYSFDGGSYESFIGSKAFFDPIWIKPHFTN